MENDEHLMESSHAGNAFMYGRKRVTHEWWPNDMSIRQTSMDIFVANMGLVLLCRRGYIFTP